MDKEGFNEKTLQDISRRLAALENRVIDLIHPIQNIAECLKSTTDIKYLINALKGPIPINDQSLKWTLNSFEKEMKKFEKSVESFSEHSSPMELKYIGNRLNKIEETIKKILEDSPNKKIHLEFSCDGYELVKKPIGYQIDDPIEDPDKNMKILLDTLNNEKYITSLIHRYGLLGESKKTLAEIGKLMSINRERVRQIIEKSLKMLRHPSRRSKVLNIKDKSLRKAILGE